MASSGKWAPLSEEETNAIEQALGATFSDPPSPSLSLSEQSLLLFSELFLAGDFPPISPPLFKNLQQRQQQIAPPLPQPSLFSQIDQLSLLSQVVCLGNQNSSSSSKSNEEFFCLLMDLASLGSQADEDFLEAAIYGFRWDVQQSLNQGISSFSFSPDSSPSPLLKSVSELLLESERVREKALEIGLFSELLLTNPTTKTSSSSSSSSSSSLLIEVLLSMVKRWSKGQSVHSLIFLSRTTQKIAERSLESNIIGVACDLHLQLIKYFQQLPLQPPLQLELHSSLSQTLSLLISKSVSEDGGDLLPSSLVSPPLSPKPSPTSPRISSPTLPSLPSSPSNSTPRSLQTTSSVQFSKSNPRILSPKTIFSSTTSPKSSKKSSNPKSPVLTRKPSIPKSPVSTRKASIPKLQSRKLSNSKTPTPRSSNPKPPTPRSSNSKPPTPKSKTTSPPNSPPPNSPPGLSSRPPGLVRNASACYPSSSSHFFSEPFSTSKRKGSALEMNRGSFLFFGCLSKKY